MESAHANFCRLLLANELGEPLFHFIGGFIGESYGADGRWKKFMVENQMGDA